MIGLKTEQENITRGVFKGHSQDATQDKRARNIYDAIGGIYYELSQSNADASFESIKRLEEAKRASERPSSPIKSIDQR